MVSSRPLRIAGYSGHRGRALVHGATGGWPSSPRRSDVYSVTGAVGLAMVAAFVTSRQDHDGSRIQAVAPQSRASAPRTSRRRSEMTQAGRSSQRPVSRTRAAEHERPDCCCLPGGGCVTRAGPSGTRMDMRASSSLPVSHRKRKRINLCGVLHAQPAEPAQSSTAATPWPDARAFRVARTFPQVAPV